MSMYSLTFSPTGGVKKVMDILEKELTVNTQIDLSVQGQDYRQYTFQKEDVCLIGVPSYGGRVPDVALERIKEMSADGALAIIVVVFGNRAYDDTLLELKEATEAGGFTVGAALAAVAEHSIMRQFGSARPDDQDEVQLIEFAKKIKKIVDSREGINMFSVPGNSPYKEYAGLPMNPKADKHCTQCGTCAEKCPVGAIPKDNPSTLDKAACISCMRCISVCPVQSRKLNKAMLFVASMTMKKAFVTRKENELYL